MKKSNATVILMAVTLLLLSSMNLLAINGFTRSAEIPVPEADLNNGGIGDMISGVDVDGDGKTEIYLVNDNWGDTPGELTPRIYKLEYSGTDWEVVWSAVAPVEAQNTWPQLALTDLDNDGKQELTWAIINNGVNPYRIVVYEHAGGDVFGVDDGAGGYNPNAKWTIVDEDNVNLRPMDWEIVDIDNDGTDEIIFADRKGASGGYYFGVCSVNNIPDNGDGSEVWELEMSGTEFSLGAGIENKWDIAVLGSNVYAFCEAEISKISYDGLSWTYTELSPMEGGSPNQSAQAVDLNGDGVLEIVAGVYDWGDDSKKGIYLLQEQGDTLLHTELINLSEYWSDGARGLWGSAYGDIDCDGKLDFVFGSRAGDVNARIFLFSYKGGDITSPDSYEFSVIDEGYEAEGGIWSVINIANIDDDPELEVLYASSASYGGDLFNPDHSSPIIVLDYEGGGAGGVEIDHFARALEIPVPEADLNNGGIGDMISGVDVDGDGKTEIYLVNDNWGDTPGELTPRIYKLEYSGTDWEVVWSAVAPVEAQNTWPQLALTDLDNDGKQELTWAIINNGVNPYRIVVYEHAGGDVFGVDDGAGGYNPNAKWTIVDEDNVNLRPMDWEIVDIDNDGTDEIIFADRKGASGGYYFGVCSVNNIPDNGDGSEVWELEMSGTEFSLGAGIENKWDIAVLGSNVYAFCEAEISKISYDGLSWTYTELSPMEGGSPNQSAQAVDLNGDGVLEIVAGVYDWGDDSKKGIYLLQEQGDTLLHTELINLSEYWSDGARGLWGSAYGDIDCDGKLDFVFGSRAGDVNARIFLFSYKGGDITSPDSYEFSVIDEGYEAEGGIWSVINIANIDDDPELEVLYASSASYGGDLFNPDHSSPIIVLDPVLTGTAIEFEKKELNLPASYILHQNYPNPFNPTTSIAFEIPMAKHVQLVIYDMLGREVISLVDNELQPGKHSVIWNGKDKNGHGVATGVYIYQLRTKDITRSKTMTFIK